MTLSRIRHINIALTSLGAAVFAALFLYISVAPKDFDQRTRAFAISKVASEVDDQLSSITESDAANRVSEYAGIISDRLQSRVDTMRDRLDTGIDVLIADILAAACELDCDRREEAALAVREYYESSILRHGIALERLQSLVLGEYDEVMQALRADLKIFSGSSAMALIFALILAIFRGRAAAHLLPISLALTGATIVAALWYALGQDWVTTVLFSNYWGWTYAVLLTGLSVLMIDIAANRARVTSFIFNAIGNAFGGASFFPC